MREIERLLREIDAEMEATRRWHGCNGLSPATHEALRQIPRELFVPHALRVSAYENRPLPIGHGQTISQPYIVALMTELLELGPDDTVLEIGTGSGYQAAILAQLVRQVHSIERSPALAEQAEKNLKQLGIGNVAIHLGDGSTGWPEAAPYDGIMVTAAADRLPPALIEQLKPERHLVIPLGQAEWGQELRRITRGENDANESRHILPVSFVPLIEGEIEDD